MAKVFLPAIVISVLLVGCSTTNGSTSKASPPTDRGLIFGIGETPVYDLISAEANNETASTQIEGDEADWVLTMSLRSSGFELWSTEDGTNLMSYEHSILEDCPIDSEGKNVSGYIAVKESGSLNTVFISGPVVHYGAMAIGIEPQVYNVVRFDIGSGEIKHTINGTPVGRGSMLPEHSDLEANSILFIDRSILDAPLYFDRDDWYQYERDGSANVNYKPSGNEFIDNIRADSGFYKWAAIGIEGALVLPFDALDLSEVGGNFEIVLEWDIDGSLINNRSAGRYDWADRVLGTPFDMELRVATH